MLFFFRIKFRISAKYRNSKQKKLKAGIKSNLINKFKFIDT